MKPEGAKELPTPSDLAMVSFEEAFAQLDEKQRGLTTRIYLYVAQDVIEDAGAVQEACRDIDEKNAFQNITITIVYRPEYAPGEWCAEYLDNHGIAVALVWSEGSWITIEDQQEAQDDGQQAKAQ